MERFPKIKNILIIVLVFNWLVAFLKSIYGMAIKSASMMADGIHSFGDGASNIIGLIGIFAASKPADKDHPYGHKKYETFATLGIAGLLFIASLDIVKKAFVRFFHPVVPDVTIFSFIIMAVTFLINIIVMRYEYKKGHELLSDILICDSVHTKSDLLSSSCVIVSLLAVRMGFPIIDGAFAIVIALLIAKSGLDILMESSHILCDKGVVEVSKIRQAIRHIKGIRAVHNIRTRGRPDDIHVDLHILVDTKMHIDSAHDLSHLIEDTLKAKIPGITDVIVHIEPHTRGHI